MGHRYEYEEEEPDLYDEIEETVMNDPHRTVWRCTIYDEDTDEELASGLGNTEDGARRDAEDRL